MVAPRNRVCPITREPHPDRRSIRRRRNRLNGTPNNLRILTPEEINTRILINWNFRTENQPVIPTPERDPEPLAPPLTLTSSYFHGPGSPTPDVIEYPLTETSNLSLPSTSTSLYFSDPSRTEIDILPDLEDLQPSYSPTDSYPVLESPSPTSTLSEPLEDPFLIPPLDDIHQEETLLFENDALNPDIDFNIRTSEQQSLLSSILESLDTEYLEQEFILPQSLSDESTLMDIINEILDN